MCYSMAKAIFFIVSLWFSFVFHADASNTSTLDANNKKQICEPMKVWGAPEVNCVDWNISPTDRELTVLLQKREGKNEPQSMYEFRLYTHYLFARVEWLVLFNSHEKTLSTLSEGQTGSNVSQTMWMIVGFAKGKCKPYLVESLNAQQSNSTEMDDLKVTRHIVHHGETPHIVLSYRLIQKREKQRTRIYRWQDTLAWDANQQQFVVQSSKGDRHYVRTNIQAYREKVGSLTCEKLRTAGADGDFGLATILDDQ